MNTKQFVIATLAGGLTLFLLGFLAYGLLLMDFMASNTGSATGVVRDAPVFWAIGLGELALAALLTLMIGNWAGIVTVNGGLIAGAVIGCLLGMAVGFTMYGATNTMTLTVVLVDTVVTTVRVGIAGAVIQAVLIKIK